MPTFKDRKYMALGLTLMMVTHSRLQLDLMGPDQRRPRADVSDAMIKNALRAAGFVRVDEIFAEFRPFLDFLLQDSRRPLFGQIKQVLVESGEYDEMPPHPDGSHGATAALAFETLTGIL